MADERYLDIVIRARNSLQEGFRSALESARGFFEKIRSLGGDDGMGLAGLVRGGLAFGAAVKGTQLAADGLLIAVRAMKGDWASVEEIVRRLPLGLGRIAGAVIDIREELTGEKADEESRNRVQQIMAQGTQKRLAFMREQSRIANDLVRTAEREAEIAQQATEFDRERVKAKHALDDTIAQANQALAGGAEEDAVLKMREAAHSRFNTAMREIAKKEAEKRAADEAAAVKEAADATKKIKEERLRDEDRIASLISEARRKSFTLQGRDIDAALEEVREKYRRMAREAKTESERAALAALESAEMAEARKKQQKGIDRVPASVGAVEVSSRFHGIAAMQESKEELRALRKIAERDAETARETNRLLAALNSSIAGLQKSAMPIVLGG